MVWQFLNMQTCFLGILILVETYGHSFDKIELGRAIIKDNFKLIAYQNHNSKLYRLDTDPYKLNDVFSHSDYQNTVADLQQELERWLIKTNDTDFDQPISGEFRQFDDLKFQELLQRRDRK